MIKIYYVPSRKITREYLLIKQGLENNPRVELVQWGEGADFVFLFYTTLKHRPDFNKMFPPDKTVFIDYHDKPYVVFDVDCMAYFKRSWVEEVSEGEYSSKIIRIRSWSPHYHPLTFAIMDEFIIKEDVERDIGLSCMIRPHIRHINRPRVLKFIKSMNIKEKKQIGELNDGHMGAFDDEDMRKYFRTLKRSRIVVTCNPSRWEGDHRTWEAFASGALVFVDKMYVPMRMPLFDEMHCIFYDLSDQGLKRLREKILYYLEHRDEADIIAHAGHVFTMKHHRASNRIDEILEVIT